MHINYRSCLGKRKHQYNLSITVTSIKKSSDTISRPGELFLRIQDRYFYNIKGKQQMNQKERLH